MKKMQYWLFLAVLLVLTACSKDEEQEDLFIRIVSPTADSAVSVGASVRFVGSFSASPQSLNIDWYVNGVSVGKNAEVVVDFNEVGEYEIVLEAKGFGQTQRDNRKIQVLDRYSRGVWVGAEGNFGQGNASLSFISSDGVVTQNVFATENNRPLGDILQSMYADRNQLFLVVNFSNKIEVVNRHNAKSTKTIEGNFENPRYMAQVSPTEAYVSSWGNPFGGGDIAPQILVIDLPTATVKRTIQAGAGAEYIATTTDKAFVGNSFTNTIYVYDTKTHTLLDSIDTAPFSPYQMQVEGSNLWVMSYAFDENFQRPRGAIYNFSTNSLRKNAELVLEVAPRNVGGNLQISGNDLYFQLSDGIYKTSAAAPAMTTAPFIEGSFSRFVISPSGDVWLTKNDFTNPQNNKALLYNASGSLVSEYPVGVGASSFEFAD
jgi:hypothetical protein